VVIHNEPAVEPLLTAFRAAGRRVPDDLSMIAIAPDELAERLGLTSIAIPAEEVGKQAVALLMAKLEGHDVPGGTLLPPRLVVRRSTPDI
jgi:DNA-binding LacI/PurR family transcriptional regulator